MTEPYDPFKLPPITPELIEEWRSLRSKSMTSAIGEYVPAEFWQVLDAYEAQLREKEKIMGIVLDCWRLYNFCDELTARRIWDQIRRLP